MPIFSVKLKYSYTKVSKCVKFATNYLSGTSNKSIKLNVNVKQARQSYQISTGQKVTELKFIYFESWFTTGGWQLAVTSQTSGLVLNCETESCIVMCAVTYSVGVKVTWIFVLPSPGTTPKNIVCSNAWMLSRWTFCSVKNQRKYDFFDMVITVTL